LVLLFNGEGMTERENNQSWERGFLAGQPEGFAALYHQYSREVLGVLLRLTHGDRAEAEDLAQETFFAAYRGRSGFRPGTSLRAWLLGIAVRRWRDTCRQALAQKRLLPVGWTPGNAPAAEAVALPELMLETALGQLTDTQRESVLLVLGKGLTYREAAEALGEPEGTIKSRVYEAVHKLRRTLGEQSEGEARHERRSKTTH
jgi:RNA polymerase sigma-70 factor, ECF subfamily